MTPNLKSPIKYLYKYPQQEFPYSGPHTAARPGKRTP